MISRTIILSPIEPALLSARAALGVDLDLQITFLAQDQTPINPGSLLPLLALMPRSRLWVLPYEFTTTFAPAGTANVTVPASVLIDPAGYNVELYQRRVAENPADPPVAVGLIAKGTLYLEGSAYMAWGPLGMINVPVVVGPPGPPGPMGPQGFAGPTGATGATGAPGNLWYTGTDFPAVTPPPAPNVGDLYLKTADPSAGSVWKWSGSAWNYTGLALIGPTGPAGPPNILSVGTVTTGAPGSPATAIITGTSPAQVINFSIPQGNVGATGPTGATGAPAVNLRSGTVDPVPGVGSVGDFYVNLTTGSLFGPKAPSGTIWPVVKLTTYWA